jgi:acyl carrier protein
MSIKKASLTRQEILGHVRLLLEPWVSDAGLINRVSEQTNLIADLGLDSVGILQVILAVEKEFDISIKDQELDSQMFSKLSNFINFIAAKIYEDNRFAYKQCGEPAS